MADAFLPVLMRIVHVAGYVALGGGLMFILLCLPRADHREEDGRSLVGRRWMVLQIATIIALLVSGVYNWWLLLPRYNDAGVVAHVLIILKATLAIGLFGVLFGRATRLIPEGRDRLWQLLGVLLIVLIIILGAVLRYVRLSAM